MTTALDRLFDDVLDGIRNDTLKSTYEGCMCPKHRPWPRQEVPRYWRSRFGNGDWNFYTALHALALDEITTLQADDPVHDGVEGFTDARGVWLKKDTPLPFKTAAHELAHNVLGHVAETPKLLKELEQVERDHDIVGLTDLLMQKSVREIEAEMTGLLVSAALGYPDGRDHTLASVNAYFKEHMRVKFPDRDRVKAAAEKILRAGGWREQAQAA